MLAPKWLRKHRTESRTLQARATPIRLSDQSVLVYETPPDLIMTLELAQSIKDKFSRYFPGVPVLVVEGRLQVVG